MLDSFIILLDPIVSLIFDRIPIGAGFSDSIEFHLLDLREFILRDPIGSDIRFPLFFPTVGSCSDSDTRVPLVDSLPGIRYIPIGSFRFSSESDRIPTGSYRIRDGSVLGLNLLGCFFFHSMINLRHVWNQSSSKCQY